MSGQTGGTKASVLAFPRARWLPSLAAAALLTLVVASALWQRDRSLSPAALGALGVSSSVARALPSSLLKSTGRALEGQWAPLPDLAGLGTWEEPALRSGERRPVALSPRWSRTAEVRPSLVWHCGDATCGGHLGQEASAELTVLDDEESVVASFNWRGALGPRMVAQWPPEQPALRAGELYAWRVSYRLQGGWTASAFVPFGLRTAAEEEALQQQLEAIGELPALRAVALSTAGSHAAALRALDGVQPGPQIDRLAHSIRARQRLPENLVAELREPQNPPPGPPREP